MPNPERPIIKQPGSGDGAAFHVIFRPKTLLPRLQPEYEIENFPATLGRHPTNDIELPFDSVSRFHARLEFNADKLRIVDLHSANGTFVNGKRVQISPLMDQDLLAFGGIEMTVTLQSGPGSKGGADEPESATSVHFADDDKQVVQSIVEADLPDDTSNVSVLDSDITDSEQLRRAKERLVTFYRLQEILRSTTDEKKLLRRTLNLLFQVLPVDRGVVLTRDPQDNKLFNPVAIQVRSGQAPAKSIGISKTILMRCLKEKIAILSKDAVSDERFNQAESIMVNQIRSAMCVPLISYHHVFGFIHLDTSNSIRAFAKDDLAFLANVGVEVAIHLHNLRMLQDKILSERMAAIGQTITGLAHNIKNVLLLSQGGMDLMAKRLDEKSYDSLGETWTLVKRGIDRINNMVKDMLDYSRARAIEKSRCQVNELLKEIRETFAGEMEKRGVNCVVDLDKSCPAIMVDVDGLDKAVVNLLLNAIEACPEGTGRIVLRTRFRDESCLMVDVEDNGGGIPAEVLPRIFFPFFTTKGSQGSGLGLAMTKKFVEDMGGRIDVKTREGAGTLFTISIFVDQNDVRLETPNPAQGADATRV